VARNFTRAQIHARARFDADLEGSNVGVSDVRVNDLINEHYAELWDLLGEAGAADYNAATTSVSVLPGIISYPLQVDFRRVTGVFAVQTPGRQRPVYPMSEGKFMQFRAPQTAVTMTVEYLPACPILDTSTGGDSLVIDGVSGWEGLIVKQVARRLLRKESSLEEAAALDGDIAEMKQRIRSCRKRTGPLQINDRETQDRWSTANVISAYRLRGANIEFYQFAIGWPWV
jgi:hypothetical protein